MNHHIYYAFITALLWGISGPIAKVAFGKGMHTDGYAIVYIIGLLIFVAHTSITKGPAVFFPTGGSWTVGLIAGLITAMGFKTCSTALSAPGSVISVVVVITASYPIVTHLISLTLLKEFDKIIAWKFFLGTTLAVIGVCLVSTSEKPIQ